MRAGDPRDAVPPMDLRSRLTLAAALSLSPVLPLAARLARLQVLEHRDLRERASGRIEDTRLESPPRGDIVDRHGRLLAQSLVTWSCIVERAAMADPESLAQEAAPLLGMTPAEIVRRLRVPGRFITLKSGMTGQEASRLERARLPPATPRARPRLRGVGLWARPARVYPGGSLARGVIGSVSVDGKGLSGIEAAFESELTQPPNPVRILRDGKGRAIYRGGEGAASPEPLRLTIDRTFQFHAEESLREAAQRLRLRGGIIAVSDPATGHLLALATHPQDPLRNPAVQDTFEPGSTFKLVTAAAAIAEETLAEGERIHCENGAWEILPGITIHDHEASGALTLAEIFERSSNIGAAKIVERLGPATFYRYSQAFGFLNKTGVGLPGETSGVMRPMSDMGRGNLASASYGYGVGTSPLQLLAAYAAVANGGILLEPQIVMRGQGPVRVRRVLEEGPTRRLVELLEGVVARGTGLEARIPGYRVAGKTGTSRKLDAATRQYSTTRYLASFVGFVPARRPSLAILVLLDEPQGSAYYGGQVAAPVFARLARQLLALQGAPPDAASDPAGALLRPRAAAPRPRPGP